MHSRNFIIIFVCTEHRSDSQKGSVWDHFNLKQVRGKNVIHPNVGVAKRFFLLEMRSDFLMLLIGSSAGGLRNCENKCASTCEKKDGCKAVDAHITSTFFGGPTCNCYGYNSHPELKEAQFWGHRSCS